MPLSAGQVAMTGIGSVTSLGPSTGLLSFRDVPLRQINAWRTKKPRFAALVEPFQPQNVVPGLNTRRMDRLSVWALVAASLAVKDAGLGPAVMDPSRSAVVFGTGYVCLELTEAYFRGISTYGYANTDPIIFPETLANFPAGHIAKVLGLRGPNVTVNCRGVSGEATLIQGSALIQDGVADYVVVVAGETLTQTLFEWYEAARVLAPCVFDGMSSHQLYTSKQRGFVPGEGVGAIVLEDAGKAQARRARTYAVYLNGAMSGDPGVAAVSWGVRTKPTVDLIRTVIGDQNPADIGLVVGSANGARELDALEAAAIREVFGGTGVYLVAPKTLLGEFDANGIIRLIAALSGTGETQNQAKSSLEGSNIKLVALGSKRRADEMALLLGASVGGGRAAVLYRTPSKIEC